MNYRALLKRKSVWVAIIIVAVGGYYYRSKTGAVATPQYSLGSVERGTLTTSISGTGQVAATSQIDLKPKGSGLVLSVAATTGQEVAAGSIIAQLDASDAYKSVRDAQLSLEGAQLAYQKLTQAADQLSLIQAENALAQAQETKVGAENNLVKAYDDSFSTVASVWLDLPDAITGLRDALFTAAIVSGQWNIDYYADAISKYDDIRSYQYKNDANNSYAAARVAYDKNFDDYKKITRLSDNAEIEKIVNETYETAKLLAEAIKSANNFIQLYVDTQSTHNLKANAMAATNLSSLNTYTGKINSVLSGLLNVKYSIKNYKDSIVSAERTIADKTESLAKLKSGADPLDIKSQELSLRQRQAALDDARAKLADYVIRAPINGIIAKLNIKRGDEMASGAVAATLIAKQQVANVSLNEVDVSKIKVGQKTMFAFDAVEGLVLSGVVSEVDSIGTVSQGVVSYNIKIAFDAQDERVKPGMSISASIITDVRQDVLIAPNSAIKLQGNNQYVEMIDSPIKVIGSQNVTSDTAPRQVSVMVGLANDTESEIASGLNEGDRVVTKTINGAVKTTAPTTAPSLLPTGGGNRGGGNFRIGG